jgi:hypothetical protein
LSAKLAGVRPWKLLHEPKPGGGMPRKRGTAPLRRSARRCSSKEKAREKERSSTPRLVSRLRAESRARRGREEEAEREMLLA